MKPSLYPADHPAIIMANTKQTISFGELDAFSNRFAHLMRSLGLKPGDGIALCLENHPYFLPICWGAQRAGLYFTAISYRLSADEVQYIVNDCGARVLITSAHLESTFDALLPKLNPRPACFMLDRAHPEADLLNDALADQPNTPIDDGAPMLKPFFGRNKG